MLDRLIDITLRNRLLMLVLIAGLGGWGVMAFRTVPIDSFPDVSPTMVQVFTSSPGLSPEDVEAQISYPIEISMYGLPKLKRVQSTSIFGLSRVNIYFEDGTDYFYARRLVMERLSKARNSIPPGMGKPSLGPMSTGLGRVLMYTIQNKEGADHSLMEKREAQDWIAKPMLRTVPGVTGLLSLGGYERQYQVKLDQNALLARDITIADVRKALVANNRNVGASFINRGGEEHIIRGFGWISPDQKGLADIRQIVIKEHQGTPVNVSDIAEVSYGGAIRRGAQVANGEESVGGYVLKLVDTNTQELLNTLDQKVDAVNRALPDGMELVPFYSQSTLVDKAVGTVQTALLEGAVLVLIFLYLFLGNIRATLVVLASLPLSVLIAFIAMRQTGMSANLMSLGGLAIGIGMMIDGSIVMLENIFRHLEERQEESLSMLRLVGEAAKEVAQPITFAISIIIIVFLPVFTLQGVEGKMFSPMAYTISFALIGALILALTLVPALISLVFNRRSALGEPRLVGWLKSAYRPILARCTRHPVITLTAALAIFTSSLGLFPMLGTEFVPTLREGTFMVRSTLPPGANLDKSIQYAKRIQGVFTEYDQVTGTYSRVGRAEVGGDPEPVNVVATVVTLKPLEQWSDVTYEELQSQMANRLQKEVPALANNFSQPIQLRTDELLSGIKAQVGISIFGDDFDKLAEIGEKVKAIAQNTEGAVDVRMQQQGGKPQIEVTPDRRKLSRYGMSGDQILNAVETGIGGSTAGQVFDGIRRFDIFMRLDQNSRETLDAIRELPLRTESGGIIPLSRVANVESYIGPKQISRSKASRRLFVQLNVRGRDMGSVVREI